MRFISSQRFRIPAFIFGVVLLAVLAGAFYQSSRVAADLNEFPPPGRMISVNGVNLHLNCLGSGSPTLILEAGLGESSLSWYPVHNRLAQNNRVCSYDRPGLGWSELIDTPILPEDVAQNLHALLINADIPPPYVLVGHSRGGIYVRAFYHQFPDETQGIVLVDSAHEQGPMHQYVYAAGAYQKQAVLIAVAEPLARVGVIRLMGVANANRHSSPLPVEVLLAKTAVQNRTDAALAIVNEITVMRRGLDPSTSPPGSLGALPLLTLTAGNLIDPDLVAREANRLDKNVEAERELARIKQTEQNDLASLSTNSRHIIVRDSGHFIMHDQADEFVSVVIDFVKTLAPKSVRESAEQYSNEPRKKP